MKSNGQIDLIRLFSVGKIGATDHNNVGADLEKIKLELAPYAPDIIVADIGDSGEKVSKLMNYYGADRVFGCNYKSSPRSTGQLVPVWSENSNQVTVDKLMQNKRYIEKLKDGDIGFYKFVDQDLQLYVNHWKNVVIRDEEDNNGEFYQAITRKDDDHYAQASVYSMLGWERLQQIHFGVDVYNFQSAFIDTNFSATPTDIYAKAGINPYS